MPLEAFQQSGEVASPAGWWVLWITDGHEANATEPSVVEWDFSFLSSTQVAVRLNQRDSDQHPEACLGPSSVAPSPHPRPYRGRMEPQASQGQLGAEGECGILSLLLPSPQSEAVTHEMEELSLQPTQSLPPLNERKNGKYVLWHKPVVTCKDLKQATIRKRPQRIDFLTSNLSSFVKLLIIVIQL